MNYDNFTESRWVGLSEIEKGWLVTSPVGNHIWILRLTGIEWLTTPQTGWHFEYQQRNEFGAKSICIENSLWPFQLPGFARPKWYHFNYKLNHTEAPKLMAKHFPHVSTQWKFLSMNSPRVGSRHFAFCWYFLHCFFFVFFWFFLSFLFHARLVSPLKFIVRWPLFDYQPRDAFQNNGIPVRLNLLFGRPSIIIHWRIVDKHQVNKLVRMFYCM